jgi:hypothetical protein
MGKSPVRERHQGGKKRQGKGKMDPTTCHHRVSPVHTSRRPCVTLTCSANGQGIEGTAHPAYDTKRGSHKHELKDAIPAELFEIQ